MLYLFGQGERADYFRHLKYLQEHEKLLSDLSETELNTLCFEVDYCVEKQQYKVCEYDIVIEDSDTFVRRTVLKEKIQKIYEDSHQNYGAPKITAELRKSGECISEKTVGNYMRQMGIKAQWVKPYIQTTIDSDFSQQLKNILNEEFNPDQPDAVWCSDITYIWTFEGFVYLTSVMDLYSRKIISWVLSETLEASHVVECIEKAKRVRNVEKPLIFHCDRGCQYVSEAFQKATKGMIRSYSKKAYPWDNACIESFHALLKREWINRFKIFNYTHAYKLIFECIETFYNTHSQSLWIFVSN